MTDRQRADGSSGITLPVALAIVLAVVALAAYPVAIGVASSLPHATGGDGGLWLFGYRFAKEGGWFEVARSTAALVAVPGAAVALTISYHRQRVSERQLQHDREQALALEGREIRRTSLSEQQLQHDRDQAHALEQRELARRANEQYTTAVQQLSNATSPVARIAGLHSLDRLAQEVPDLRATAVDVWCAYLRLAERHAGEGLDASREPEQEVRDTCVRLLLSHLRPGDERRHWADSGLAIDLTGASLPHWDATGCAFPAESRFVSAIFGNNAAFNDATFGDLARFDGVTFGEQAAFARAKFGGLALFRGATFGESAQFEQTTFGRSAVFAGATFGDGAWFGGATFGEGAHFEAAGFGAAARFDVTTFGAVARFDGAAFGDRSEFNHAIFGNHVRFDGATFGEHSPTDDGRWWIVPPPQGGNSDDLRNG